MCGGMRSEDFQGPWKAPASPPNSPFRLVCVREGAVWRKDHSRRLGFAPSGTQLLHNRNSDVLIVVFFNPHLLEAQWFQGNTKTHLISMWLAVGKSLSLPDSPSTK